MKDKLRQLRLDRGLLQKDVAKAIGIGGSTYAHFEQGIREPNNEILRRLCKFYNVTSDYLLGLSDY